MKKFLIAAALLLASFATTAGSFSASRSSFSSSSSRSSSFSSSRSYSAPSRSYYSAPSRSSFSAPRVVPSAPKVSRPVARPVTVNRTTVVNRTVYRQPHYSYYNNPAPRPSFVGSNAGWYAFGALAAWNLLSAHERASTPMPDVSGLMDMSWDELSRVIWADGNMSKAEAAVVVKWRELHGAGK